MRSEVKFGTMPTIDDYVFRPNGVEVSHIVAGSRTTETKPLPEGEWMTPVAMGKFIEAKIAAGEKEFSVRTIEPTVGLTPARQTMKFLEKTTLDVVGKTVPALKWSEKNDMVPNVESTEYTDEEGVALRSENDIGGMKIVMVRADRAIALAKADPPELLESTFIKPDRQIKGARESVSGDYIVKCADAPIGEWPSAGAQTSTKVDEHTVKVHVDVATKLEATKADIDSAAYRKPSAMINSTDAEVVRLKVQAVGVSNKDSLANQAERMRKYVYGFIKKKSFDVGFASAAETARTGCGDCTEHAVLLCAMLRADAIPARCVSGIVYVDGSGPGKGFFGYHMWTQALLESGGKMCWVDVDAAISETRPMDGTHLAITTLALADGETVNALLDILPTLGKLKVEVVK
jgi:transglutaminase-like putative cysteine protease